jgi:hypothetical protein
MLARNQSNENNCLATGINEVPWLIVNGDMYMTNSRRYCQGTFSKNWNDPQVFCSVLNEDTPLSQRLSERRIYNQFGRRFVFDCKQGGRTPDVLGALGSSLNSENCRKADGDHDHCWCVHDDSFPQVPNENAYCKLHEDHGVHDPGQ